MTNPTPDPEAIRDFLKATLSAKKAASEMAREFEDIRDFAKQVSEALKFKSFRDAEKLRDIIKQTANNVSSSADMMDIFRARAMSARFATSEISRSIGLSTEEKKKLNLETEKYAALERGTAEDRILGESLVKSLNKDFPL